MPEEPNKLPVPGEPAPASPPVSSGEAVQVPLLGPADLAILRKRRRPPALIVPSHKRRKPTMRERAAAFFRWFRAGENLVVCALALVVLVLHLLLVNTPPGPLSTPEWMRQDELNKKDSANPAPSPQYIFDELHYIPEAIRFLHREGLDQDTLHWIQRPEHPPLGKWLIAAGIFIFGDNPNGWRLLPIVFSIVCIFVFYLICRRLVWRDPGSTPAIGPPEAAKRWARWTRAPVFVPLLATFLFATENLSFVQGQIAMLDVFYLAFMLLGILFYLRGNYVTSGVFMGLSMLGKAMAVLAILGLLIHWALTRRSEMWAELKFTWNALRGRKGVPAARSEILSIVKLVVAIPVVWLALLTLLEYAVTHQWVSPLGRTLNMLSSHLSLVVGSTLPSGIASRPWSWLYFPGGLYYWYTPHFLGSIGWTVWAFIMPSMAYLGVELVRAHLRERQALMSAVLGRWGILVRLRRFFGRVAGHEVAKFALIWFISVYGLLIVLELATDRLMYHFYFYPAVPPVCLAIAWSAWKLWQAAKKGRKWRIIFPVILGVYILATIAAFVIMSPFGTDLITLPTMAPNVR